MLGETTNGLDSRFFPEWIRLLPFLEKLPLRQDQPALFPFPAFRIATVLPFPLLTFQY